MAARFNLPVDYRQLNPQHRREVREQYIKEQEGLCVHCNEDINKDPPENIIRKNIHPWLFPKGFFLHPIHLHHDHYTGLTIGAVHARCNAVLWQYYGK